MLKLKPIEPDDFLAVMDLNRSLVSSWHHYFNNIKLGEASWDDLSPKERFHHGGPWNDLQTFKIHFKHFSKFGQILVAYEDEKMVGEIEFHRNEDRIHIDWMMVHPNHRRKGIGEKLVGSLIESFDTISEIWSEPEPGSEEFYHATGFVEVTPHFQRYCHDGISKELDDLSSEWKRKVPKLDEYIYGDATHDRIYLQALLNSAIEYAKLFGDRFPCAILENDRFQIVNRHLPTIVDNQVIFISSNDPLNYSLIEKVLNSIIQELPSHIMYFTTTLGDQIKSWDISTTIKRLKKSILT